MTLDINEFAKGKPKRSNTCSTCHLHPEVAAKIREFLEIKADPKRGTMMGYVDLWRALRDKMGYPLSRSAFLNHIKNCEAELYGRIEHQ